MDRACVALIVSGERALFPRPEFRRDLISYDVMTPSAARGILDRVHWRPAIRWVVDAIAVLNPIEFDDVLLETDPIQRHGSILRNVAYRIDAHFILTDKASTVDAAAQHQAMFHRRAKRGAEVFLGRPDFQAQVQLAVPANSSPIRLDRDFGWIVHDADHTDRGQL